MNTKKVHTTFIDEVSINKVEIHARAAAYRTAKTLNEQTQIHYKFGRAAIDVTEVREDETKDKTWFERIHVYGRTQEHAETLRDHILKLMEDT